MVFPSTKGVSPYKIKVFLMLNELFFFRAIFTASAVPFLLRCITNLIFLFFFSRLKLSRSLEITVVISFGFIDKATL